MAFGDGALVHGQHLGAQNLRMQSDLPQRNDLIENSDSIHIRAQGLEILNILKWPEIMLFEAALPDSGPWLRWCPNAPELADRH